MPTPSKRPQPSFLEKNYTVSFYSILFGAILLYIIRNPQYRTGMFNDDAIYVLGARSLWHLSFHSLLLRPDYPLPGLPLLLAPWVKLASPDWTGLEWLAVLSTILMVYLFSKWARLWLSPRMALVAIVLFAFNPLVAKYSGILMPGPFYTTAVIASFLMLMQWLKHPTPALAVGFGALLGWASLVRPEGVLLLVSITATLLLIKRGRKFLPWMLPPLAAWGFFLRWWWQTHLSSRTEYGSDISALIAYWTHHFGAGIAFSGELIHAFIVMPMTRLPFPVTPLSQFLSIVAIAFFLAAMVLGFRRLWLEDPARRPILTGMLIFSVLYVSVHLFWHVAQPRYGISILPFVVLLLSRGIFDVFEPMKRPRAWSQAVIVLLLVSYVYRDGNAAYQALTEHDPMNAPPWQSMAWLDQHVPPDAQVVSNIAPSIELYTNRPALSGLLANNVEMFLHRLTDRHLTFIVDRNIVFLTPGVGTTENPNTVETRMRLWLARYPERFRLVHEDPSEQTRIYQVTPEPGFTQAYDIFTRAYQAYQSGHLDQTLLDIRESTVADPAFGSDDNLQGAVYLRQNDLPDAERAFLSAVERIPDSPNAMINLATLYRREGKIDRSEAYVQRALDTSRLNGDEDNFKQSLQTLERMWNQNSGLIFFDSI